MSNERIQNLIKEFVNNLEHINTWPFYSKGSIPRKKLKNAVALIGKGITDEDILFFVDFTVFGSGKDGLVFTHDKLFWRNSISELTEGKIDYAKIKSVSSKGDDLVINTKTTVPARLGKNDRKLVQELLMQIAKENQRVEKVIKETGRAEQVQRKRAEKQLETAAKASALELNLSVSDKNSGSND